MGDGIDAGVFQRSIVIGGTVLLAGAVPAVALLAYAAYTRVGVVGVFVPAAVAIVATLAVVGAMPAGEDSR